MTDEKPRHSSKAGANASAFDVSARSDPPVLSLRLLPNRPFSGPAAGVVIFLAAAGLSLPLFMLAGTSAAWGMLPHLVVVLVGLSWAIARNFADRELIEELMLWPDLISVRRSEPRGEVKHWTANPYWVTARLHDDAHIEKYLTLKGNGREIELGAFLAPWEREKIYDELTRALRQLGPNR